MRRVVLAGLAAVLSLGGCRQADVRQTALIMDRACVVSATSLFADVASDEPGPSLDAITGTAGACGGAAPVLAHYKDAPPFVQKSRDGLTAVAENLTKYRDALKSGHPAQAAAWKAQADKAVDDLRSLSADPTHAAAGAANGLRRTA